MNIHFSQVAPAHSQPIEDAIGIYLNSFPANERHSVELIRQRVEAGSSQLHIGRMGDDVVCMALLWPFKAISFVLLDYLAVKNGYRGANIGSQFMDYLSDVAKSMDKTMVLEVEHPDFGSNKEECMGRINFYITTGAYLLDDFTYILPALDSTTPTQMVLMLYPPQADTHYHTNDIKQLVIMLYQELYNRPSNDPLLNSFLGNIPQTITLCRNITP